MFKLMNMLHRMARKSKERILIPVYTPITENRILDDKIVMITGGTGGIGIAIARSVINCGGKVIICGTNADKLRRYSIELGENAKTLSLSLDDCSSLQPSFERAVALFDEHRIDILINAAGLHGDWDFNSFNEDEFDRIMDVNVKGTYCISQIVAKHMMDNKIKGHILNIASSSSLRPAWTPYQISKWAVTGMTKGLADILLPHGIIVNAIAPGPTATSMVKSNADDNLFYYDQPAHRYSTPEEIANLAVFMVSSMGDMIVGDTYYITGGSGTISYHQ